MESSVDLSLSSEALTLYLSEVKNTHQDGDDEDEEHFVLDVSDVDQATEFLNKVGLSNLSKIYREGKEISDVVIKDSVRQINLTPKQAHTVKSRVKTLNRTLRNRQPRRKQRQDIRDIAWNAETSSTGTRSRSATPDSLDFVETIQEDLTSDEDQSALQPYSLDSANMSLKIKLKWTNSEPLYNKFNRTERCDIAHLDSSKVILKGYHTLNEFGSIGRRERSGSVPSSDVIENTNPNLFKEEPVRLHNKLSRSHDSLLTENEDLYLSKGDESVSFEKLLKQNDENSDDIKSLVYNNSIGISVDDLSDSEYQHLKPLLWLEITAIFDQYKIGIVKRKSCYKNKRGNVFGVNLSTLVMRDMPTPFDNLMIPQIFQTIIVQLNKRCLNEDGLLRVAGQQQKLTYLCGEIETKFYNNRQVIDNLINEASPHDLTGILKKLLRDIPDTILTMELLDMFYKCSMIPTMDEQIKALNLLVLLLPVEHRNTFRLLLDFFLNVTKHEEQNRMNLHNVAMIIAPSFFSPKLLLPKDLSKMNVKTLKNLPKDELAKHINGAAVCCCIMELLLRSGRNLWLVPGDLAQQAKDAQKKAQERKDTGQEKRFRYGKTKLHRSSTQYESSNLISPRIKKK